MPCNVIPDEILTDHPDRFRALIVESGNPAHSLADSKRMREAIAALELVVVIDVAMTETARLADYVLPATTQFEKYEATFFNFEFPHNVFHLRHPVLTPPDGPLPEAEIHARLVEASGASPMNSSPRCARRRPRAVRRSPRRSWNPPPPTPSWARWPRSCCTARSGRRSRTAPRRPRCCGVPPRSARWRTRRGCAAPASASSPSQGIGSSMRS